MSDSRESERFEGAEKAVELERRREATDRCRQILEGWQDRLTFKNLAIAERYLKGDFVVHVHFTARRVGHSGDGVEYCALFDDAEVAERMGEHTVPVLGTDTVQNLEQIDTESLQRTGNQGQRVMLVGVVKTPDRIERVAHVKHADFLENVHGLLTASLFFSPKSG